MKQFIQCFSYFVCLLVFQNTLSAQCSNLNVNHVNYPFNQNIDAQSGTTADFQVSTLGTGLTYSWEKETTFPNWASATGTVNTSGNINTFTTPTLSLADDGSRYRCIVTNNTCNDTVYFDLFVKSQCEVPVLSSNITSYGNKFGDTLTFYDVPTQGTNLTYQWYRKGKYQSNFVALTDNATYVGTNTHTLTLPNIQVDQDLAQFKLIATNGCGSSTGTVIELSIGCGFAGTFINAFYIQPSGPTLDYNVGQTAMPEIDTFGAGNTIIWEEKAPSASQFSVVVNGGRYSGQGTKILQMSNLTLADDGHQFRVIITDGICSDTVHTWQNNTGALTINVSGNASCNHIATSPNNFNTFDGGSAGFQTTTQGIGLTYSWEYQLPNTNTWTFAGNGSTNGNDNLLTVSPVDLSDNGTLYRCIVSDGSCNDTSATATLYVNPVTPPTIDTIKTYIGDLSVLPTQCVNDTFIVPILIDAGTNILGAISLNITFPDQLLLPITDANNNLPIHNLHPNLQNNINAHVNPGSVMFPNTNNVSFSWYDMNGVQFSGTEIMFELKFVKHPSLNPVPNPFMAQIHFDTSQAYFNEYSDVNTSLFPDDSFTDNHTVDADSSNCSRTITGLVRYGINPPFKPVYGPVVSVLLTDLNSTPISIPNNPFIVTDNTGSFTFADVPPGMYRLELDPLMDSYNAGGANSTDALRSVLGFFGTFPLIGIQNEAAETDGVGGVNATDAMQIARHFTGEISVFLDQTNNELSSWVQQDPIIDASTANVQQDLHVMIRGDVNASFDPSNLNGGKVSEVTLALEEQLEITKPNQVLEIPFRTTGALEIGAISMVINFPYDIMTIEDVQLNENVNSNSLRYTIQDGRIRISWFNMMPINLETGETLLTLHATTLENINTAWTPTITRGNETELANAFGEVLTDITLTIPELVLNVANTIEENLAIRTFPNPASEQTTFNIASKTGGTLNIQVFNALGRLVKIWNAVEIAAGETAFDANVQDLPIGQYSIQMTLKNENGMEQQMKRLMIVR